MEKTHRIKQHQIMCVNTDTSPRKYDEKPCQAKIWQDQWLQCLPKNDQTIEAGCCRCGIWCCLTWQKTCNVTGESDFHERSARMCLGAVKFGGGCWQSRTSYSHCSHTFLPGRQRFCQSARTWSTKSHSFLRNITIPKLQLVRETICPWDTQWSLIKILAPLCTLAKGMDESRQYEL